MKSSIKKIYALFLAALTIQSAAYAQQNLSATLVGGTQVQAVLTDKNTIRLLKVEGDTKQDFVIEGKMLQSFATNREWKNSCKHLSSNPKAINGSKDSLYIKTSQLAFSKSKIESQLGYPLETPLEIVSAVPAIQFSEGSYTLKAYKGLSAQQVMASLQSKMQIDLDKLKAGQPLAMNITGEGAFACDLVLGLAQVKINMEVWHEYALPQIFSPIASRDIETLSKNLAVNYSWKGTQLENAVKAGAVMIKELSNVGVKEVYLNDDGPNRMYWNSSTVARLAVALLDDQTGKAKIVKSNEADQLSEKLKSTQYTQRKSELSVLADFGGGL